MITLNDDDLVGIVRIVVRTTKMMMFSLISQEVFSQSHVEWYCSDLESEIAKVVSSELARAKIGAIIGETFEELRDEVDYIADPDKEDLGSVQDN